MTLYYPFKEYWRASSSSFKEWWFGRVNRRFADFFFDTLCHSSKSIMFSNTFEQSLAEKLALAGLT